MKKYLFTILVVFSISLALVGTAAAAGTASLVSVQYVPGKGPVFTFKVSGNFSKADLKGALHVDGGADFALYCTQVDETTVKCTTSDRVSGANVSVTWDGSTFWAYVPEAPIFCYGIYDWTADSTDWQYYGENCQDTPASYGDFFLWNNPNWGTSPYVFLPQSPACPFNHTGDAYYYPGCPDQPQ